MEDNSEGFEKACRPVIEWLNKYGNPHASIIITTRTAELLYGETAFTTDDYLVD